MVIGLFIDIWNWLYTRNRIQLIRQAAEIWQPHRLRISRLGVLYTIVEVDKSIPEGLIDKFLTQRLNVVDDALVAINLDGLIHFKWKIYGETDTIRYVLVKFIPNMPHWTWWYFISSCAVVYVAVRIFIYFNVWSYIEGWVMPVINAIFP